jgi:hypothetical protein
MDFPEHIPRIKKSAGDLITLANIAEIVESPLIEACELLYRKGIRTVSSSANDGNFQQGNVFLSIDFSTLSDENKLIALRLPAEFPVTYNLTESSIDTAIASNALFNFEFPANNANEAREHSLKIVERFKVQRPEYLCSDTSTYEEQKRM